MLAASTLLAGVAFTDDASAEEVTLGTLAPKKSPWGKVFDAWAKAVDKKTSGKLQLKWYFNGQQGDEKAMVAKIRTNQLDGAAVTSVGLSSIHKDVLAMQMPGLFNNWDSLDTARDKMMPEFQEGMKKNGFVLLGSGDVGLARTMSKGRAIKSPDDLKAMKVYAWQDDLIAPKIASEIGYTPVLSSVPGLLPALSAGRINVITGPALAATQLQWWSHLDHVNENVAGVGIGGLVMSSKRLEALPGDLREVMTNTGQKAGKMLTKRIRSEDEKAYAQVSKRMTVVKLSKAEQGKWDAIFKKVRQRLGQSTFPSGLVTKLEKLAGR
jgi:TRAP-type C4-dicarboxylate transport system substrate-binding protein